MSRKLFIAVAFLAVFFACAICLGGLLFLGFNFDQGPFDSTSRTLAQIRLQGGTRVFVEADVPTNEPLPPDAMISAVMIVRLRLEFLKVPVAVRAKGDRQLVIEIAGREDSRQAVESAIRPGVLEFVNLGDSALKAGMFISTTGVTFDNSCSDVLRTPTPLPGSELRVNNVYRTVMTGSCLSNAALGFSQTSEPYITIVMKEKWAKIFRDHTAANVNRYLAIVVDKKIISAPLIKSAIPGGTAVIEGRFTRAEANQLMAQLRYGSLPFPLKIIEMTPIGK